MNAQTTTSTLQVCSSCGGGAAPDVHFCPQCARILSLGRPADYFTFMGLRRALTIDAEELEQRYRTLSRQFHPDYFYNAPPAERRASLERASYLNDACRTLRDPVRRLEYVLGLEGLAPANPQDAARQVPPALLEAVFALNEELEDVRKLREDGAPPTVWQTRLERARTPIDARRAAHESDLAALAARWDDLPAGGDDAERRRLLEALRDRLLERQYIRNLLAGIEKERHG